MAESLGSVSALLAVLQDFQKQVDKCCGHQEVIRLFCQQIIPLLEGQPSIDLLRAHWKCKRQKLLQEKDVLAETVIDEIRKTVGDIKLAIKEKKGPIIEQVHKIENMLAEKVVEFSSRPFYYSLFDETRNLLQLLAENPRYCKLCEEYAQLVVQKSHIKKDDGIIEQSEEFLLREVFFAPSLKVANDANDAVSWERLDDPAIARFFLEVALRYWSTSESFFEDSKESLRKQGLNALHALAEKTVWLEIARAKNCAPSDYKPRIFTTERLKKTLQILVNELQIFVLNDGVLGSIESSELVKFELRLEENRLWIFVHLGASEKRCYCLKRFNESIAGPSAPLLFMKALLEKHSHAGNVDIEVDLAFKSENIPKVIGRLGLRPPLNNLFFGRSQGTHVVFHGAIVTTVRDRRCRHILEKLAEIHRQKGNQRYTPP